MLIEPAAVRTNDFMPILRAIAVRFNALVKAALIGGSVHRMGCKVEWPANRDGRELGEGRQDVRTAIEGAEDAAG
ncbi:hypothetical protein MNO14_05060 [Luteimonas sp. S4-F44]|uniref:hypothetical protein n=1 Tax=Luteimonas sp. S4-F44 TaxID=2925842 RepID=UPI001F5399AA|nr:hypothetical protein [Luteimonas sp. S4-F44]UNK43456.1 hypothetical protein MNO14_05060 [Luteimonas sp. S4-F44]